jgi:TPR repeat protein
MSNVSKLLCCLRHATLTALLVAVAVPGAANAGLYEVALAAAEQGDFVTALRLWRSLAEQGDADAQYNLGVMYSNGDGVPRDYAEAMKWHRKAADQGNGNAQFNLGFMYDLGRGMPQNYIEALKWYSLAANQGVAIAQFKLGVMYHHGQGVPQDYVHAYMWFSLAALQFPASETENRDEAVKARDFVASKMTPAEIAEAQKLLREWKLQPER